MSDPRPTPPPAVCPPMGRLPKRLPLHLADGYETSVYVHSPPDLVSTGKLPVLYAHGIQSHPGWFYGSAMALADAGYTVYQVTRRGSGDNPANRGAAVSAAQLLEDVSAACAFVQDHSGCRSKHLLGVSWGGKLLAAYAAGAERLTTGPVASLTMLSPGIVSRVSVGLMTKLSIVAALISQPDKLFDIPLSRAEMFTQNQIMLEYLRGDEYRLHQASARFLYANRVLDKQLASRKAGAIDVPTTLILSSRDRIINNAKTRKRAERLAGQNLKTITLDGCHTLEFEPEPHPLYQAVVEAITQADNND